MERRALAGEELAQATQELSGWSTVDGRLEKKFKFDDFARALEFVNKVGDLAEAADHHPDITFGWGYADIQLMTHDRAGITDVDIALAKQIDGMSGER
jgi:4a-hydroxytetrahydrobiopterin dehydratase